MTVPSGARLHCLDASRTLQERNGMQRMSLTCMGLFPTRFPGSSVQDRTHRNPVSGQLDQRAGLKQGMAGLVYSRAWRWHVHV